MAANHIADAISYWISVRFKQCRVTQSSGVFQKDRPKDKIKSCWTMTRFIKQEQIGLPQIANGSKGTRSRISQIIIQAPKGNSRAINLSLRIMGSINMTGDYRPDRSGNACP